MCLFKRLPYHHLPIWGFQVPDQSDKPAWIINHNSVDVYIPLATYSSRQSEQQNVLFKVLPFGSIFLSLCLWTLLFGTITLQSLILLPADTNIMCRIIYKPQLRFFSLFQLVNRVEEEGTSQSFLFSSILIVLFYFHV